MVRALPLPKVCFFDFTYNSHNLRAGGNRGGPPSRRLGFTGVEPKAQLFFREAERADTRRVQMRGAASGLRALLPGPARARCSASAGTQRRLLGWWPPEAPQFPRSSPPAPGLGHHRDANGISSPAASARRPPLTWPELSGALAHAVPAAGTAAAEEPRGVGPEDKLRAPPGGGQLLGWCGAGTIT